MLNTPVSAAALYVALFILGNIILQVRVIRQRTAKRIGVGHGNDRDLEQAMRVHGNYAENVPFGLAALVLLALGGASVWPVHLVGVLLVAGRIAHAVGLGGSIGTSAGRVGGMVLTFASLAIAALVLLSRAFAG